MIALKASMVALIAGLLLAGTSTIDSAHAQKAKKQSGGYAACKAKLSQVPPCSQTGHAIVPRNVGRGLVQRDD